MKYLVSYSKFALLGLSALLLTFGCSAEDPKDEQTTTTFTVTFNSKGGSAVENQAVNSGELASKPTDPTREGHVFQGWYKEEAYTNEFDFATETVGEGGTATQPANPTRTGYAFKGRYTENTFKNVFSFSTPITYHTTLYAKWVKVYTVTFNTDAGSTIAPISVEDGSNATQPADPTREGYNFGGWFKDVAYMSAFDFTTETITADIILYAKWNTNSNAQSFTVTFNTGADASQVSSQTIKEGGNVALPKAPTRDGYVFGGWFKEATYQTFFDFNTEVITSNITLYGKWVNPTIQTYNGTTDVLGLAIKEDALMLGVPLITVTDAPQGVVAWTFGTIDKVKKIDQVKKSTGNTLHFYIGDFKEVIKDLDDNSEKGISITFSIFGKEFPITYKPLDIYTWQDLQGMRQNLSGSYVQRKDIVFPEKGTENFPIEGFEPIGKDLGSHKEEGGGIFDGTPFNGSFDGNGFTITDLYINRPTSDYQGLFGVKTEETNLENIRLKEIVVKGRFFVGSIVGETYQDIIVSGYVRGGTVEGEEHVGGMVGKTNKGVVIGYTENVNVSGEEYVGGLVGSNHVIVIGYQVGGRVSGTGGQYISGLTTGSNVYGYMRGTLAPTTGIFGLVNGGNRNKSHGFYSGKTGESTLEGANLADGKYNGTPITYGTSTPVTRADFEGELFSFSPIITKEQATTLTGAEYLLPIADKPVWKWVDGKWPAVRIDLQAEDIDATDQPIDP